MKEPEQQFKCVVCGASFGENPRVQRWLTGNVPLAQLEKMSMCWVCTRLSIHLDQEAKDLAIFVGQEGGEPWQIS